MSEFQSLLPPNSTPFEKALEVTLSRADDIPVPFASHWNAHLSPAVMMPWLAWALSVDFWEMEWDETRKREVLAASVPMHRLKGTRQSVELALSAIGITFDLSEWFQHGGAPHTFKIDVFGEDVFDELGFIDQRFTDLVTARIDTVKPVREHYDLRVGLLIQQPVFDRLAVVTRGRYSRTVVPAAPAKTSQIDLCARVEVRAQTSLRDDVAPSAPPQSSLYATAAMVAVRGRAILRDAVIINVPKGAVYVA